MRSMTGFGVGDAALTDGRVIAEIRSVNQRFLDVRARLPRELADLSLFAEQVVRERLRRGRVELLVHTEGAVLSPCVLDKGRARAAFRALGELRDELAPGTQVPLSLLSAVPDLFSPPASAEITALRCSVKLAVERAIDAMEAMCHREGEALAADLRARCHVLRDLLADVARLADGSRDAMRRRLRERIDRLFAETEVGLDPARVEAEVALLAERSDFAEELTRLASHLDQFCSVVAEDPADATFRPLTSSSLPPPADRAAEPPKLHGPADPLHHGAASGPKPPGPADPATDPGPRLHTRAEPMGRRVDFLLQEMLREANTLGAKAQDAALAQRVVVIKVELERLREQVQNIE